jgi:integrase
VKEAVADKEVKNSEEDTEARPGAPRPRTRQDGSPEQPNVRQRSANVRPRHSRIRSLVLFGAPSRVQPHRRRIGVRLGNWLTPEQGRRLLECATPSTARETRDHAMVGMLIGCGLRRAELLALRVESIQQREEHWVIADLVGKGGHVRTVPIPAWVKSKVDAWMAAAAITHGPVFRAINKAGRVWGDGMSPKVPWDVVRAAAARAGIDKLAPHDLRRTCARLCHLAGGELDQIQFLLGHVSIQTTERYLGCKQKLRIAVNDRLGIEPDAA